MKGTKKPMKTHEIQHTDQGYSYVEVEMKCNHLLTRSCDSCNTMIDDKAYLVYVLERLLCPTCFAKWKESALRIKEDIKDQTLHHKAYYDHYL